MSALVALLGRAQVERQALGAVLRAAALGARLRARLDRVARLGVALGDETDHHYGVQPA